MNPHFTCEQVARAGLGAPVKRQGAELFWHCPHPERHQHRDADPSLAVSPKKDVFFEPVCGAKGKAWALAAFLAGCDPSNKPSVKVWLKEHELLNGATRANAKADGRGPAVAEFVHCDATGKPVYKKVRHEPGANGKDKDYLEWHFDGGEWKPGRGGITPPLYRLPQIVPAPFVFLFESHTDTDRAAAMGLTATTSGGADSWKPEYAGVFAGKRVCLVPDNNAAGARYQATVWASLYAKASSLKIVSIAPHLDFRRWVDAGGTAEQLLRLHADAPEWNPTDGAELLDSTLAFVRRFVSLTKIQAVAVTLWVAHTYAIDAADCTPYLHIDSAEKGSGKTRLLEILELIVRNPWLTARTSAAALVRKIDAKRPTLLLDESDTAFSADREYAQVLRGILNSGYRRSGRVSICVGQGAAIEVRDFCAFSAKAIAGIGHLPDTVADRSIPMRLKRARRGEVERLRARDVTEVANDLQARIAAWCAVNLERLRDARPNIPDALSDRQADVCEPLLAIADLAGGDWPQAAKVALLRLCADAQAADDSIGVKLLADTKAAFFPRDDHGNPLAEVERIASEDLAKALGEREDRPWAEWKAGKPITKTQLAGLLSPFDIVPKTVRLPDGRRLKGYEREQFEEVWALYLPGDSPIPLESERDSVTTRENTGENGDFQSVMPDACHASENAVSANKDALCHGVTDRKPGKEGEGRETAPEPIFEEVEI